MVHYATTIGPEARQIETSQPDVENFCIEYRYVDDKNLSRRARHTSAADGVGYRIPKGSRNAANPWSSSTATEQGTVQIDGHPRDRIVSECLSASSATFSSGAARITARLRYPRQHGHRQWIGAPDKNFEPSPIHGHKSGVSGIPLRTRTCIFILANQQIDGHIVRSCHKDICKNDCRR
jgi:hypothetical protein